MKFLKNIIVKGAAAALALGLSATIAVACPSWNNPTVFGTASLPGGFVPDPYSPRITAGGRVSLARCFPNTGWSGFVITRPDFRLQYGGNSPTGRLVFRLSSNRVDTVLLINAPDARWYFNDDSNGTFNSTIVFNNPMAGQYDVWTGTYNQSSNNPARLTISEF